jgi:hypothetical protein
VPVAPDNTRIAIDFNSDGKIIGLSVTTANGQPIPANVWCYVWLMFNPANSGGASVNDASGGYYGPFVVKSAAGRLDIDVNNLTKPDGTKGSIPAGSYTIKFADKDSVDAGIDPQYVGTSETSVSLKATGDDSSSSGSSSGGGGCDAGASGVIALLAAAMILRKKR